MSRLERKLNDPKVALVAGVVAVALNVVLYLMVFVPRVTPLVGQVYFHAGPIGTFLPKARGKANCEAKFCSEVGGKSSSEESSSPEPPGKSRSGANDKSRPGAVSYPEAGGT